MAKRGTLGHPKCKRLGRALGLEAWAALGLLEAFWHWVGRYRPTGQLSAEDMLDAADEVGFRDAEQLAVLLVSTGWLDQIDDNTYYVHDWHDHADDTVKKTLAKRKEQFANGQSARKTTTTNDTKPEQIDEQESFANHSRTVREPFATSQSLSQSLSLSHEPLPMRESERHTSRARDPDPPPTDSTSAPIQPSAQLFEPPDAERVAVDFNQRGMAEADCLDEARRFLTYHQSLGWKDRHNRQYVDWTYPAIAWVDQWKKLKLRSRGSPRKRDQQAGPQDENNRRIREALNLNP